MKKLVINYGLSFLVEMVAIIVTILGLILMATFVPSLCGLGLLMFMIGFPASMGLMLVSEKLDKWGDKHFNK